MNFVTVHNGLIDLNVAVAGDGPLILSVHGFPELWYSWRYQIAHFSEHGYKVAALDVRGYGGSSKPHEIEAYSIRNLASDVAAAIDQLGGGTAILFGHDWGAPIASGIRHCSIRTRCPQSLVCCGPTASPCGRGPQSAARQPRVP